MHISERIEEWKRAAAVGALCGPGGHAIVGGSAGGFPHLHVPGAGELFALGAVVVASVGAGYWMFRRFGDRPADGASLPAAAMSPPRKLEAWGVADDTTEEREPVGV